MGALPSITETSPRHIGHLGNVQIGHLPYLLPAPPASKSPDKSVREITP
jgi:hypothetical protein